MWILKNNLATFAIALLLFSCNSKKKTDFAVSMEKAGVNISDSTFAVVKVGGGGCISCNQSMINTFCNYVGNPHIQLLIYANANKLDVSCFLDKNATNVHFCNEEELAGSNAKINTKVYLLKNSEVDTLIDFNATNWEGATKYVDSFLRHG
jgi:hypothetical protein